MGNSALSEKIIKKKKRKRNIIDRYIRLRALGTKPYFGASSKNKNDGHKFTFIIVMHSNCGVYAIA